MSREARFYQQDADEAQLGVGAPASHEPPFMAFDDLEEDDEGEELTDAEYEEERARANPDLGEDDEEEDLESDLDDEGEEPPTQADLDAADEED